MSGDHPGERRERWPASESDSDAGPAPVTPRRDDVPDADQGPAEPEPQGDEDGWVPV